MQQSIPALHSNRGKHCISGISIWTHPLDRGCTAPASQSEMAHNAHSCYNTHLVVVVRVLGCSVSSETSVVERRTMVGRLWMFACWLVPNCAQLTGGTFWETLLFHSVDQPGIWDAQVKNLSKMEKVPSPWLDWGLVHVYQHVWKINASHMLIVHSNKWWTRDSNLCFVFLAPPFDRWKRHDPTGIAQKADAFVVKPFDCDHPFSRPVVKSSISFLHQLFVFKGAPPMRFGQTVPVHQTPRFACTFWTKSKLVK